MIGKISTLLFLLQLSLFSGVFEIKEFESDIFSRDGNKLRQVALSMWMEGENLDKYGYQITDALNIIISSFYLEDLFTSKGKEQFKASLKKYTKKKYGITINTLYLNKFKRANTALDADEIVEALREAGCCKKGGSSVKKVFDTIDTEE